MSMPPFEGPPTGELEELPAPRARRPWLWATGAALVVIVAGAAIVGVVATTGSHTKSPIVVLSDAPARTTHSGTSASSLVETVTADGHTITGLRMQAANDYDNNTGTATIEDPTGAAIETIRTIRGVSYASTTLPISLPGGAHWVSITPAELKINASAAQALGSNNPSSGLGYLSAIEGAPKVIDHNPLGLVSVTHYGFTLNLETYIDQLGATGKAEGLGGLGASLKEFESLVDLTKVPGEAWIDHDGRVVRFTMTLALIVQGHALQVLDDVRFSDFGRPVSVTAPAASDTVPFPKVPNYFSEFAKQVAASGADA